MHQEAAWWIPSIREPIEASRWCDLGRDVKALFRPQSSPQSCETARWPAPPTWVMHTGGSLRGRMSRGTWLHRSRRVVAVGECCPGQDDPAHQGEPGQKSFTGRRWRPRPSRPHHRADYDKRPEGHRPDPSGCPPTLQIQHYARNPHCAFDHIGAGNRTPQTEAKTRRASGPQGHVGCVSEKVQDPMTDD